jgi:hypothetical protein
MATLIRIGSHSSEKSPSPFKKQLDEYFLRLTIGEPAQWGLLTLGGLAALIVIWAAWVHGTWAAWGSLTVDCGREMYVSSLLAEGKMLYRDVSYNYGPVAPYFNAWLFRWFGARLEVLYWAGAISALGSAAALYFAGMRMSFALAGWTAGAVVLCEAFHPTLFAFPLPYSFAAVYGCLIACLFLWLVAREPGSKSRIEVGALGMLTAVAALLKFEFGAACLITLSALILVRGFRQRERRFFLKDLAAILPGVILCGLVIRWMVSIHGAAFITQENFQSWPGSYFMKTYGKTYLASAGCDLSAESLAAAAERIFSVLGVVQGLQLLLTDREDRPERQVIFLRVALFVGAMGYLVIYSPRHDVLSAVFFPLDMVVYAGIAATVGWWYLWRHLKSENGLAIAILFTFSAIIGFRFLFKMLPIDYPVFYNGPVVLSFLVLPTVLVRLTRRSRRYKMGAELVICLACLMVAALRAEAVISEEPRKTWLRTDHGDIRVSEEMAEQYGAAIQFMKEKAALGEQVLSVPEDTSLYFLSGTHCPTRVAAFTPGMLIPGKMTDEAIAEIEKKPVRYLVWSNRLFPEYGVIRFGTEFDQAMGTYLRSHYRRVGPLTSAHVKVTGWTAFVWERIPEVQAQ